jgi:hypothetical protein
VLGGTGLVEAGTYGAILLGTIAGGLLGREHADIAAASVLVVAAIGRFIGGMVPPAPPSRMRRRSRGLAHHRASIRWSRRRLHIPRLFLAIGDQLLLGDGRHLAAQFPHSGEERLPRDVRVATLFLAIFSVGVAVGSVVSTGFMKAGARQSIRRPRRSRWAVVSPLYWNVLTAVAEPGRCLSSNFIGSARPNG